MKLGSVGIYRITCTVNNRQYFGSSCDLKRRLEDHKRGLRTNRHINSVLQADWNLHGPAAFVFEVLVRRDLSKARLHELENIFIHAYWDGQVQCYNKAKDARGAERGNTHALGFKHTAETKAKMSAAAKGHIVTPETRDKMRGNKSNTGRKLSPEVRAKMAKAHQGKVQTVETRAKRSESLKGNTNGLGHKPSAEGLAKRSESMRLARAKQWTGWDSSCKHSVESRAKMSEARRAYWAKRKEERT